MSQCDKYFNNMTNFMRHFIENHTNEIVTIAKNSSYLTSASLVFGSAVEFMNENVGAVGGTIGIATWALNYHFNKKKLLLDKEYKIKDYELKAAQQKRRSNDN